MNQKDKELLFVDLSARLPYSVICQVMDGKNGFDKDILYQIRKDVVKCEVMVGALNLPIEFVKPYLRPMSSMTEEEESELNDICCFWTASDDYDEYDRKGIEIMREINNNIGYHQKKVIDFVDYEELTNWLNSHHFDYRCLIEKGLALEAPEDMYK